VRSIPTPFPANTALRSRQSATLGTPHIGLPADGTGKVPSVKSVAAANRLLASVPSKDRQGLLALGEPVELAFGDILARPGERIRYAHFPMQSSISLLATLNGRPGLEVGLIGNEGMLGITLILNIAVSPLYAVVQSRGIALRIDAAAFCRQLAANPALRGVLQRYLHVLIAQLAQTAACTRFHTVEARLARRLLMSQDRAQSNAFHVTQEFLAAMLGVRRVGVTKAAIDLQNDKLIRYSRGEITVLDRDRLELRSCPCYAADQATYAQAMK
jgi:CRP-like cAMP-binding protein